jgi:hypothetical protein
MEKNKLATPDFPRRSKCASCGSTKVSNPTSRYFEARPNQEFDSDWDGCEQGSGS